MNAAFAFLHHLAAFGLFAALMVEFVLIRGMVQNGDCRDGMPRRGRRPPNTTKIQTKQRTKGEHHEILPRPV